MKKLVNRLIVLCTDEKADIRTRLFRVIILMAIASSVLAAVGHLAVGAAQIPAFAAAGCVLLSLSFYATIRVKDCRNVIAAMIFVANSLLFPAIFLMSGGMKSGAPLWQLFGLVLLFLFLTGWRLYLILATSVVSIVTVYIVSAVHPYLVRQLSSENTELAASCLSILLMGLLIGLIFYFQTRIYEKAREESERQQETIRRISESRNLFFANMSHEIRTPINTIIGLNEMTLREDVSDEVAENALNIQNASKILLALINDILDLSKIESGRMEIVPVQYETGALFSDLVNIIWIRAHEKKLEFRIDIDENIPSVLYGDEVRIKQILVNLLTNAVKYTRKGTVSLTVKGESLGVNRIRLKMAVRDTGIGIKRESMDSLFSSFKRVDEAENRKIEGTGLGLSISKQLVDLMGGTITVDSIYTKGSVFTVTLEQQIVDASPLGSMRTAARQGGKNRQKYERKFEAPEARVLLVDDNEMNLMVAKKLLRDTKVQVDTAMSGAECLAKTKESRYHVIFMDQVMPEMDGEETLKVLRGRAEGYCQDTPVIALTANVMSGAAEWYQEKGFDGYLAKPINGAVFEAVLQKFLPQELIEYSADVKEGDMAERISAMMVQGRKKKKIRITTDCVCDLPEQLLKKYDIRTMFYYVSTEEGHFKDVTEIAPDNLLEYMHQGHRAHSGPASVAEYEAFFADNLMEAEQVIHISMSSRVSKGYATALAAAHGFGNVTVLDSENFSSGLGLIVVEAAKLAENGAEPAQIEKRVEELCEQVSTSFIVGTPENLYRSGRMDERLYRLCHFWHLHSVLELYRGRMYSSWAYMGRMDSSARRYVRRRLRNTRRIDERILFITYAGCTLAQLEEIKKEALRMVPFQRVCFQQATSAIASNCGIGAFGLIFFKKGTAPAREGAGYGNL